MKKRGLMLALILIVVGLQMISAIDTEIKIKTVPEYEVQVSVMDYSSGGARVLEAFKGTANQYGDISFVFSSTKPQFGLVVFIKLNGVTVAQEKEIDLIAGQPVYLELAPKWFTFIETPTNKTPIKNETVVVVLNQTIKNETILVKVENKTKEPTQTGFAVFGSKGILSDQFMFIVIGGFILLAGGTGLIVVQRARKKRREDEFGPGEDKGKKEIVVRKLSDVQKDQAEANKSNSQRLIEAEKKIIEAQEEIKRIKVSDNMKKERINEAKKRLIQDEQELMKLRRGED